jgi:pyruvate,water dikinase
MEDPSEQGDQQSPFGTAGAAAGGASGAAGAGGAAPAAARSEAAKAEALSRLRTKVSPRQFRILAVKTAKMRQLLWWREEFRDVSTKHYHLIRLAALRLAEHWVAAGVIERADDFWFTEVAQVWDLAEGRITPADLRQTIAQNRRYHAAYRNYRGPEELGPNLGTTGAGGLKRPGGRRAISQPRARETVEGKPVEEFFGLGCQASTAVGRARVIEDLDQIGRLRPGDVLVTRFTDTGWTPAFARLGGVVTECGGVLCHAAIVSREFAIPCVVALANAAQLIPDGALVEVDGAAGRVTVLSEGSKPGS